MNNVRVLTGEEEFLLHQRENFYKEKFAEKYPEAEINEFLKGGSVVNLQTSCSSAGLFAEKKLVMTREFWNAEKWETATKRNFFEQLEQNPDTTLIIIEPKPDKRTKWAKALLKLHVEEFKPLKENDKIAWTVQRANELQIVEINRNTAAYLVQRVGGSLRKIESELQKFEIHGGEITKDLVDELTIANPSAVVWDFTEQVTKKRLHQSLRELRKLERSGESPYMVLSMLQREARIVATLKHCEKQGMSSKEAASAAKLHPFVVQKTMSAVKQFTDAEIINWYESLLEIEHQAKTGGAVVSTDDGSELHLMLEQLLYKLCDK